MYDRYWVVMDQCASQSTDKCLGTFNWGFSGKFHPSKFNEASSYLHYCNALDFVLWLAKPTKKELTIELQEMKFVLYASNS